MPSVTAVCVDALTTAMTVAIAPTSMGLHGVRIQQDELQPLSLIPVDVLTDLADLLLCHSNSFYLRWMHKTMSDVFRLTMPVLPWVLHR